MSAGDTELGTWLELMARASCAAITAYCWEMALGEVAHLEWWPGQGCFKGKCLNWGLLPPHLPLMLRWKVTILRCID